ncbi:response regulator transcription factor [Gracilibacillus dipsosauri]|uniref:response regulator transcription factor n=1 Tax=Gracilibacillus dipsosauri TaxID=178340 RepID=UPI0024090F0D
MRSILIIDDDISVREGLAKHVHWRKLGLCVSGVANDGEQALQLIYENQPDIILTDIYMPKMDGLTLIEKISREFPAIHVVIHSGYNHFDNARKAIQYGVKHFFLKPSPVSEIEAVIQEVMQEMEAEEKQQSILKSYEEQHVHYLYYQKDTLIRHLLIDKSYWKQLSQEKLTMLDLTRDDRLAVSVLEINRPAYITRMQEQDWQLMKYSVGNILEESMVRFQKEYPLKAHLLDYSDSTFVIVTFLPENLSYLEKLTEELVKQMLANILYYLKVAIMFGVSLPKSSLKELPDAYKECLRVLEIAEEEEWNQLYYYKDIRDKTADDSYSYPFETVKAIHQSLTNKEFDELSETWTQFVEDVSNRRAFRLHLIQTIVVNIFSVMLMEDHATVPDSKPKEGQQALFEKIYQFTTAKELLSWMTMQIEQWVDSYKAILKGKKTSRLVIAVKEYVEEYYDQEITLTEIADSLYVNRNYLSQLFKKVTGESFVHYLNHYRINKAKKLLSEKRYMVYEISEMVGYQNSTYFSQVFKAITGRSPSEFF